MKMAEPTPSQTVGPFFHLGLQQLNRNALATPNVAGERITLQGRVLDGDGQPVPDAQLETWQADAAGKYAHPEDPHSTSADPRFNGFSRIPTDANGFFQLTTIKPGPVPAPDGTQQAPHIVVLVFSRGLLKPLITRIYFPNDPANDHDPVLNLVPAERRTTLIAKHASGAEHLFECNLVLQGEKETVFFDC
jgi:protocatechuate 3,4-dioxygenase alpha subunit